MNRTSAVGLLVVLAFMQQTPTKINIKMSSAAQVVGGLSPDASKMFRVRKTCLKMLNNRGYIVDDAAINMTTDDFRNKFGESPSRENLTILVEKADDQADQLFVFFPEDEKVGVKPIKTYCQKENK